MVTEVPGTLYPGTVTLPGTWYSQVTYCNKCTGTGNCHIYIHRSLWVQTGIVWRGSGSLPGMYYPVYSVSFLESGTSMLTWLGRVVHCSRSRRPATGIEDIESLGVSTWVRHQPFVTATTYCLIDFMIHAGQLAKPPPTRQNFQRLGWSHLLSQTIHTWI